MRNKNTGQKMLNLKNIESDKQLSNLIGWDSKMPEVSYCQLY
jgi:hypothetical protein